MSDILTPVSDQQKVYGEERRHRELMDSLTRLRLLWEDVVEILPIVPQVNIPDFPEFPTTSLDVNGLAAAMARYLPEDHSPEITEAFEKTVKQLERLNKKVAALSIMPSGGSSDGATETTLRKLQTEGIEVSNFPTSTEIANDEGNPVPITSDTLATESTLDAIRDYFLASRSMQYATASVPTSSWTTVLTYTPAQSVHLLGLNAERTGGVTNITYRFRLRIDGAEVLEEGVNVSANSWTSIELSVASGQVVTVQAFHSEVTSQTFNASLNVRNLA